jgi:processive 1,2-diacylglycerol beta-glucosyltransferase
MVSLHDKGTGAKLADISDAQFDFLMDQLEEESLTDRDYYIDSATVDMLAAAGGDPALIAALRRAVGNREGVEVRWSRR